MRPLLALALFAACSDARGSKLDDKPIPLSAAERNFVCERLAIVNPKATCTAEYANAGDMLTHTARVTIDKDTLACALNAGQVSMVCAPLVYQAPKQEKQAEPEAGKATTDKTANPPKAKAR